MSITTLAQTNVQTPIRKAKPKDGGWGNPIVYFVALIVIAICLGPVLYVIIGGFRDNSQINNDPAGLPSPWRFDQYSEVLKTPAFWRMAWNSTFIADAGLAEAA